MTGSSLDTLLLPCSTAIGTHIDGLGHQYDKTTGNFYNGIPLSEMIETLYDLPNPYFGQEATFDPPLEPQNKTILHQQLKKLGLQNLPPIVTRGIVLNMLEVYDAETKRTNDDGVEYLPARLVITPEKVQEALDRQGLQIEQGDVVLFHTGWEEALWRKDNDQFESGEPGIGVDAARFLICHQVFAVGADNWCGKRTAPDNHGMPM
jgi:kynurenine formamidase